MTDRSAVLSIFHVYVTQYENHQFDSFRSDIRPLRTADTLRYVLGLKLYSVKLHLAVMAVALCSACLYLSLACLVGEDDLQWSYWLGDVGLAFGSFRHVFDLCVASPFCGGLGGMTSVLILYIQTGGEVDILDKAYPLWTTLLVEQDFDASWLSSQLSAVDRVFLWKVTYLGRLAGLASSVGVALAAGCFATWKHFTLIPGVFNDPLLLIVTIFWIFYLAIAVFMVAGFVCWGIVIIGSQMLYYAMVMRGVVHTFTDSMNRSLENRKQFPIKLIMAQFRIWKSLEKEFSANSDTYDLIVGFCIPGLLFVWVLWFYAACFLATSLLLKLICYLTSLITVMAIASFLIASSLVAWEQCHLEPLLYRIMFLSRNQPIKQHYIRGHDNKKKIILSTTKVASLLRKWIKHETAQRGFIVSCGFFGEITAEGSVRLVFEAATYFLLLVSTIGIPEDDDLV